MKKTTYLKNVLAILLLLFSLSGLAQNLVPFVPRYDEAIKGDMLLIGNSNLSVHPTDPYNGNTNNETASSRWVTGNRDRMVYVDIDNDGSTFNSSSADLDVPSDTNCYQVVYAGLYWSSVVEDPDSPKENIKFRTPESGGYLDLTGTQIYYQNSSNNQNSNTYVYYRDVTDILAALSNPEGTYTVANISTMTSAMMANDGGYNTEGLSAGWSLFIIYEDPLMPSKYITSFDGFTKIDNQAPNNEQTFPISGFQTVPAPQPVRAKYAFSALEGDRSWSGDYLELNGTRIGAATAGGTVIRPSNNFFNSSVSIIDPSTNAPVLFTDRNPASSNTLGFDAGIINITNPDNSVIANGATSANIRLGTNTDIYYFYFSAFAIEIIAPNIVLTKIVEDAAGNDIGGQVVDLGDELHYTIGFQNTGNDDATDMIIRDVLPINVVFNYPQDIATLPNGVTVQSYDPATRELIFRIDESVVEENDPISEIRFKVTVVSTCSLLSDACANSIDNQAYATYKGTINPDFTISDDPSYASNTGCLLSPGATNFIADLNDCTFEENVVLCGASTVLTAGNGYDAYTWTNDSGVVIGNTQSITVTSPGTYYVHNQAIAPCQSTDQIFNVITYGAGMTNPVIPYADNDLNDVCPNDGKFLPKIFLCGGNDSEFIQTNINDSSSIIWEKLDEGEGSCDAVSDDRCANESDSCTWNQVATGPDFLADAAGQYRLTINYTGGCFNQFYFNVYENLLEPTVTSRDIFCTTPGEIRVGGVPSGYEYSLNGTNYQPSNVFSITTPGTYPVYIRQVGVSPNPCIFSVPDVQIRERDFTVSTIITQPYCNGERGSVVIAANDVRPQYFFSISQGGTVINTVGPVMENDHTFANLNPGTYTVSVSTEDGCTYSEDIEIIEPPLLTATAALTQPLTCTDGEITVYPDGGTPPYYYFVNSTTEFQSTPEIVVTAPGVYNITVVDANNCSAEASITVDAIPEPQYNITDTDILCYNSNDGVIQFNVTNANGYTIAYSIDNGATYSSNPTFSNLSPGDYSANIRYSMNGVECFSTTQVVSITQPDSAVTASAGVSELAGCGPSGTGRVRITNPQGGTAPYEYSFDNQMTWTTTNEAYVAPGTYTLYIRDANGCIFPMSGITLDPEPVAPTINISDPDFNCDGSGNSTVTVTNPGTDSFTYRYLLDGVENTNTADPRTFLDVPSGSHTVTVEYTLSTVPTYSNLLIEDFGSGAPTTTSGIASAYCFNDQRVNAPYNCGTRSVEDNQYSVASFFWRPDDPSSNNTGAWYHFNDHTTNGADPDGRYLLVNIGSAAGPYGILYSKPISNIIPNQDIKVDLYLGNLIRASRSGAKPDFIIQLVDSSNNVIAEESTGEIDNNELWNLRSLSLNPGNNNNLTFVIRSGSILYGGNDAVIDDITVYQLPVVCTTSVDFPFVVGSGNEFSAAVTGSSDVSCSGSADGSITITTQNFDTTNGYQYSIDNGATWITQTSSPHTITGLSAGAYTILVRYDTSGDCDVTLTQNITEPTALSVNANVTTPVTCINGATIQATASGGTSAYTYELLDVSLNLVSNFPSNGILTNVSAGDYIVRATDANGCSATTPLTLAPPTPPTATITNADYCYDATNGASLEVTASGGQLPYEYRINGGAYQSSNVFSNLVPGTYTIEVRDAYGCTYNVPAETIAAQVKVNTVLTKDLDCTASPDAVITGTISNGYAPYTYSVSIDGGAYGTPTSIVGTTFSYTTAADGTYQFLITDANGCIVESSEETVSPIVPVTASTSAIDPTCNGFSDGTITINALSGVAPFTYSIDGGTTFVASNVFGGLIAGNYDYVVMDSKGCSVSGTTTLSDPLPFNVSIGRNPIQCNSNVPGSLDVTIDSGGIAPYTYTLYDSSYTQVGGSVNTSSTSHTFSGLSFGDYYVTITDSKGCEYISGAQRIETPPNIQLDGNVSTGSCATGAIVDISVITGAGPFTYSIYGQPSTAFGPTASTSHSFTGLDHGVTYFFQVVDAGGCFSIIEVTTPDLSPIAVNATATSNVSCNGNSDGSVDFTIEDYDSSVTSLYYEIQDALTNMPITPAQNGTFTGITGTSVSGTVTGLPAGNYKLFVRESDGTLCTASTTFQITQPIQPLFSVVSSSINANCNVAAQVTLNTTGGTGPYQYAVGAVGFTPSIVDFNSSNVLYLDPSIRTNWDIVVRDNNGCEVRLNETIATDPEPVITAVLDDQCNTLEGQFSIDVTMTTTGVGPYTYSLNGGAYQTRTASFTYTNLSSGTHTVSVRDANGCGNTVTVDIEPVLGVSANVATLPSCSNDDGVLEVTGSGGSGNYEYEITSGPLLVASQSTNIFNGLPTGTYTVTITDTTTGCTNDVDVTLEAPTPVTFTSTATDVSCNGGNDGAIVVNLPASNDNPVYRYSIDGGVTTQTSNVFSGLAAGTYTVLVTSGRGCTATEDVTIGVPATINVAAPVVVDYACTSGTNTTNFASITVNSVTGGSGNYTIYEFIKNGTIVQYGANNTLIESDYSGGTYTINVYDDNGCLGTTSASIAPYIELDALTVAIDNAITCTNDEDITVAVTSTGGTPSNLEFTLEDFSGILPTQTNTTGVFTGLPVGNYIITVENLDTGCSKQTVHYVNNPDTFDLTIDSVVDVTCFSDTDGSVNVTLIDRSPNPTDESGPFSYSVADVLGNTIRSGSSVNAGPITISGLASGTYTITANLTNVPFCTVTKNFTITAPTAALEINETHTEITCVSGYNDGTISVSAIGGWPGGYEYQLETLGGAVLVPYGSISNFTGLTADTYIVSVRDSRGCIDSETVVLDIPAPITATVTPSTTMLTCFGDTNATITASMVSGGQGSNYTYTLNMISPVASSSGPQLSPVFSGLGAGTYTITVNDGFNCEFTSTTVVINEPTEVEALLARESSPTCLTDASLTLSATGGTGPYEYSDTMSFATVLGTFATSVTFDVAPGTYEYYVRDANSCVAVVSNEITINPLPALTVNLDTTNATVNCAGDSTGVIVAQAQGGLGNYVYTLQDAGGNDILGATQDGPGVFTGLPAGNYRVEVESRDCLITSAMVTITEPSAPLTAQFIVTDVTCFGSNDGMIEVVATGGTGVIKYAISPQMDQFFDEPIFEGLFAGTYQVIAQDELGCYVLADVTVNEPAPLVLTVDSSTLVPELCEGDMNGAFSVDISGGSLPYSVALDDINGPYTTGGPAQTRFDFTGLAGGNHIVYVIDGAGCETEWEIDFPESVSMNAIAEVAYDCDNNMPGNMVTVTVTGNADSADLSYSLNGGPYQSSNVFVDVVPGIGHYVDVMHTNGCTKRTPTFDIDQLDPVALVLENGGFNEIVAVATGGSGDYEYTLNGEPQGETNRFIIYSSGTYTVTVTDSNGCTATASGYFEYIDVCIPNYFTPNGDGNLDEWGPGCTSQYKDMVFDIYDRYGRKVATLKVGEKWDGTYNGKELPTGDYWYVVKLNDPRDDRDFVGHFTLYR